MKKKLFAMSAFLISSALANAQDANVASGNNVSNATGSVSYSIGQVTYSNSSNTNGSVNQGVQQPYEFYALGTSNFPNISLELSVYPNPTTSIVNLSIKGFNSNSMSYQLLDATGRLIREEKISNAISPIDLQSVSSANYILTVYDKTQLIKSFKIIKTF